MLACPRLQSYLDSVLHKASVCNIQLIKGLSFEYAGICVVRCVRR